MYDSEDDAPFPAYIERAISEPGYTKESRWFWMQVSKVEVFMQGKDENRNASDR